MRITANICHNWNWKTIADELVRLWKRQQAAFVGQSKIQEATTTASYLVPHMLAKRNKPFSDGEFVQECMIQVINVVCPELKGKIESVSLSRRTVVRQMVYTAENLRDRLINVSKSFQRFSLALDDLPSNKAKNKTHPLMQ